MTYFIDLPPIAVEFERWEYVNYRVDIPLVGIYEIIDELGRVIYVGKSTNLPNRIKNHMRSSPFAHEIKRVRVRRVADLQALDIYETHAINTLRPVYNRDKVYRPSAERIAEISFAYTEACDDVEMYRDQVEWLLSEDSCTLRDIDLEIAEDALEDARHRRSYLRQKLAKTP